jgi:type VI secretion system secreted protein Hcp
MRNFLLVLLAALALAPTAFAQKSAPSLGLLIDGVKLSPANAVDGKPIPVADKDGYIPIESFQFGVARAVGSPGGRANNREASAPNFSEISIQRNADAATLEILARALGIPIPKITLRTRDGFVFVFSNVIVSSHSLAGVGEERMKESFTLNYSKIEVQGPGEKLRVLWNLETQSAK